MLKRIMVFIIIFLIGMSCVHFGGVQPYTTDFGIGMLCSLGVGGWIAFVIITDKDLQ